MYMCKACKKEFVKKQSLAAHVGLVRQIEEG